MYTEIEAKLKVDSLLEIEKRLERLNAEFVEEQYQSDTHFDDTDGTLLNADSCLRLRCQKANDTTKYFITFKGAKEQSDYKKRVEIETAVTDGESMEKLLIALGYKKKMLIEKTRRLYKYGGCEVALDYLKLLGEFVEIEGPGEKEINEVQKSLGLENVSHVPKSYAALIAEKMSGDEELDT